MAVKQGDKVSVEYEGKLEDGEIFDSSNKTGEQRPLIFIAGENQVIKGFDDAVMGMNEGEEKSFELNPSEAYGEKREDLKKEIPRDSLPQDQEPKKGMMLVMSSPEGQQFPAVIDDVTDKTVVLNLNHPLAGKKLLFSVKVVGIENPEEGAIPAQ
jgi:FKBP-type peptidyl-prolyl cis-trans isomerase 2